LGSGDETVPTAEMVGDQTEGHVRAFGDIREAQSGLAVGREDLDRSL
jgi:hypothetical protein